MHSAPTWGRCTTDETEIYIKKSRNVAGISCVTRHSPRTCKLSAVKLIVVSRCCFSLPGVQMTMFVRLILSRSSFKNYKTAVCMEENQLETQEMWNLCPSIPIIARLTLKTVTLEQTGCDCIQKIYHTKFYKDIRELLEFQNIFL